MKESRPTSPGSQTPEAFRASAEEDIALLAMTIDIAERADEAGAVDTKVRDALVTVADLHISNDPISSGGMTIPGTDEWMPGERHDRYSYNKNDEESGNAVSVSITTELGKRLETYANKHRKDVSEAQEANEEAKAKPAPAGKKPKAKKTAKKVAAKPKRHLKVVVDTEASGEEQTDDDISDLVTIDRKNRGHVSGSHSPEGRSRNGQYLSKYELDQIAAHKELIRDGLAALAVGSSTETGSAPAGDTGPPVTISGGVGGAGGAPSAPETMAGQDFVDSEFMRELPVEMAQALAIALNDYMRLAAMRSRTMVGKGGKTSLSPQYITGPNGEQRTENYAGIQATVENVEALRLRYERVRGRVKAWTADKMTEKQVEPLDQKVISYLEDKTEIELVGLGIQFDQERLSEPTGVTAAARKGFYNWWARQGTGKLFSRGTVKKAAAMGIIGLPVGVAVVGVGAFIAGPLAGGVAAVAVARGVSRGLLRGHIEKQANAKTEAQRQREDQQAAQQQRLDTAYANDTSLENVTGDFSSGVEQNVRRNRRRLVGGVAVGVAAGIGGAFAGEAIHHFVGGGSHDATKPGTNKVTTKTPLSKPAGTVRPEHGHTGRAFTVESGSGITREIQQYAAAHHYQGVSQAEAGHIYQQLHGQFGRNMVNLDGSGPSTYLVGSDVRLTHPGMAHWSPGVEAMLRDQLAKAA